MVFPLLTVFDFSTIRANFIHPINVKKIKRRSDDFAILVPIFNDLKYLTYIDFLAKYKDRVVLCTTTDETPEFMESIRKLSKKYNFRVSMCDVGTGKKNPWAIFNKTLLAHDAVLKSTIGRLKEKYVIFIDGDTEVKDDLQLLAGAMDENGFDIASVKVLPSKRRNVMENLQGVEYDIAMQARLIYPWLTSGAGMIAKREVMISIMKNHSLFFNGGDVEIGRLADMMGYKVGHIPIIFYTDVPTTFKTWVKQRFSWMCGMFRHSIINFDHNLKHPFHFIYYTFMIYFLIPFKTIELLTKPLLIPGILVGYMIITIVANWRVRNKWMIIFPFYALFQIVVIIWFGAYRYISTVIKSKNIGKIHMRYNPNNVTVFEFKRFFNTLKNYSVIAVTIFAICATSVSVFQRFIFGRTYEAVELAQDIGTQITNKITAFGKDEHVNMGRVAGASDENNQQQPVEE